MYPKTEIKQFLHEIGLNSAESTIYLKALELGSGTASTIAEAAGLNRITTYEALKRLSQKGFIKIRVKRNSSVKHFFPAEYPEIIEKLRDKEQALHATIERAETLKEELQSHFSLSRSKPVVFFYEGQEGIKTVLKNTLQQKPEEILSFASVESLGSGFDQQFLADYWNQRVVLGIPTRGIVPDTGTAVQQFSPERNKKELRRLRFISPDIYTFKNEIDVYGDSVSIISLAKGTEHGVIIQSKEISDSMRALFETLWQLSGK